MSSLPHSWTNQQNALNKGKYDQWLLAKDPG
jgi:phospholipase C